MAEELVMPRLSDTMESGTVARWLLHEGDQVHAGDVVAEIETDKATMEYQSDVDGVLLRILVGDGESAALGAPIALVGAPGEEVAAAADGGAGGGEAAAAQGADGAAPATERREVPAPDRDGARRSSGGPLKASPIARRMAEEAGVDLRELAGRGSGPDGRIVRVDVERQIERRDRRDDLPKAPAAARAVAAPAPPPRAEAAEERLTTMQRAIAHRMTESKSTVPHFYLEVEVDMGRATSFRAELNSALADAGEKVSVNDFIIRACALALADNRQFHRSFAGDRMVYHPHADIGVAVALDDGLVVPVIRAAETKTLRQIAQEARDLATRARAGQIKQPEIENATFTISNLGMFGVSAFAAIINPPEPGILAVGATVERAVVRDGQVVVRPIMGMTLSVDHRATSGAEGARFLGSVRRYLESPVLLGA